MAGRLGRLRVAMQRVVGSDRVGERSDLAAAHVIGRRRRELTAGQVRGEWHAAARSAGLAVRRVLLAARAVLLELHAIRVVTPVLLGDVVALLADRARHRDLRANVCALGGHGSCLSVLVGCLRWAYSGVAELRLW